MIKRNCDAIHCFANDCGKCNILKDTDWVRKGNRPCPFFANKDTVDREQIEKDIHIYELWYAGRKSKEREDEDGRYKNG